MNERYSVSEAIPAALSSLERSQDQGVGIFENAISMLHNLGYDNSAVYVSDDYHEALRLASRSGTDGYFPDLIPMEEDEGIEASLNAEFVDVPDLQIYPLHCHGQELGALVVAAGSKPEADEKVLVSISRIFSVLAYIDMVKVNCQRERLEKEVFFAQALASRLMAMEPPQSQYFRMGVERWRTLDISGDFFDLVPIKDGRVYAYIGRCSGKGLKTALEMTEIMHYLNRCMVGLDSLKDIAAAVNRHLVEIKKRTHLASLCLIEFDPLAEKVSMVRAGNFITAIYNRDSFNNISKDEKMFLGMFKDINLEEEVYDFKPGSALICATEGVFTIQNRHNQTLPAELFNSTVQEVQNNCDQEKALVNAAFERLKTVDEYTHTQESMIAISVEFLKRDE